MCILHFIFVLFLFLITLTGCWQRKTPVLYVHVEDLKNNSVLTQPLTSSGRKKEVSSFSADAAWVYQVSSGSLHSDIVNGKVRNTISDLTILDSETHPVHDALLEDIAEVTAASIDHDIMEFEIWNVGTHYYSFIKLNVNWSDPCELYEYHPDSHSIHLVGAWDNVNLLAMELPK